MNIYELSVSGINVNEGIGRFGGVASLYEKYLIKFPADKNFEKMCEALTARDVKTAFSYAHALKGLAGNLSLQSLYDSVYPLVEKLRGESLEGCEELLLPVTESYKKTVNAIIGQK